VKIAVNAEKCQGHARCIAILPEVFDTDEMGYAFAIDGGGVPAATEAKAREAAVNCPEQAIEIIDD
jgi:ferredoxin